MAHPRMLLATAAATAMAVGLLGGIPARATDSSRAPSVDSALPETVDRLIVTTTSPSVSDVTVESVTERAAAEVGVDVIADTAVDITGTVTVVDLGAAVSLDEAEALADTVERSSVIRSATPDYRVQADIVAPNDPSFSSLWGVWNTDTPQGGYSVRAPIAWPTAIGTGAVVAVLDTGITAHPDLDAQVLPGYDFVSDIPTANDGDGRDANPADPGDWVTVSESNTATFAGCTPENSSWHGTHVAGTVAAIRDNSIGVVGVAPGAKILPVRVLGKCGGDSSDIIAAIEWASGGSVSGVPANPNPADVINMFLGGGAACFTAIQNAITNAVNRGTTVVVSAGNSNTAPKFPADCNNVISVAASAKTGAKAYYSSYGSVVDVTAPGGDYNVDSMILSTLNSGTQGPGSPTYGAYQGTSMAAPHVAGLAAMLMGAVPTITPAQVETQIKGTVQPFASPSFCGGGCGTGYVDAGAAITTLVPGLPQSVAATAGYESLGVSWQAPSSGVTPSGYEVAYSTDDSTYTSVGTVNGTSTTISGLSGGTAYWVRVRALNGSTAGPWQRTAATTTALARRAPDAPTALTVLPDATSLLLTWTAPADNGGSAVLYYDVAHTSDDNTWVADDTTAVASTTITSLTDGTPYRVRVRAVNALGAGPWAISDPRVAPQVLTAPSAPQLPGTTGGDGALTVTWSAPASSGGRAVTGYAVETSTDDSTWTSRGTTASTSMTLSPLTNGQAYSIRIAAINVIGQGPWATTSGTPQAPAPPPPPPSSGGGDGGGGGGSAPPPPPAPTVAPPSAPRIDSATAANTTVSLAWTSPDDTGGAPIEAYVIELDSADDSAQATVSATSYTFSALVNGTAYRARVAAVNSAGQGDWSAWTGDLVPLGPAEAPQGLAATAGDASATITWQAPTQTGGSEVSGYVVEVRTGSSVQELVVADTSTTLVGLRNATAYAVRVAATTGYGTGTWSAPVSVTPRATTVSAPLNVRATVTKRTVRVTWAKPATGTALRYVVSASINGKPARRVDTTMTTRATFTVPARTTSLLISVKAFDRYGPGPSSDAVQARRG